MVPQCRSGAVHAAGIALLSLGLAACGGGAASPVAPTPDDTVPTPAPTLVQQLASGGYVIFFRHAERDTAAIQVSELAIVDNAGECVPGSELTRAGMDASRALGAAFVRLGIGVGQVHASPTCRTTQMAALMFPSYVTTRALIWPGMWQPGEEPQLTAALLDLIGTVPPLPANTVLISHNDVMQAGRIGFSLSLEQAEAAIFRPRGGRTFEFVGRIAKEQWTAAP